MKKLLFTMSVVLCSLLSGTMYGQVELYGCTDSSAGNYNPEATIDDGSCCYTNVATVTSNQEGYAFLSGSDGSYYEISFPGSFNFCMVEGCYFISVESASDPVFSGEVLLNGNALVTWQMLPGMINGYSFSLNGNNSFGCTDAAACNYNPEATCENGSCTYDCYGCTDPNALNYDATALNNDGTCCYETSNYYTIVSSEPVYFNASAVDGSWYEGGYIENSGGFCSTASCLNLSVWTVSGLGADIVVTAPNGDIVFASQGLVVGESNITYSTEGDVGCGDPSACNYSPNSYCFNYSSCDYSCFGCTDPNAPNFNPTATVDDGTCCTTESWTTITTSVPYVGVYIYGYNGQTNYYAQTDENGVAYACLGEGCYELQVLDGPSEAYTITFERNGVVLYSQEASIFLAGSFSVNAVLGCMEPTACNYNPEANCSLGQYCDFGCYGCTDPNADNFNPDATLDNGTCCYNLAYITIESDDAYWTIYGYSGGYSSSGFNGTTSSFCLTDGCYNYYVYSYSGTPAPFSITDHDGNVLASGIIDPEYGYEYGQFSSNAVEGCIDPYACNYNPAANCPNYSICTYNCYGCTDASAPNFNPEATIDNGTCCYTTWYSVSTSSNAYWSVYSSNSGEYYTNYYGNQNGFCSDGICFEFVVYSVDGLPVDYSISDANGNIIASGTTDESGYAYVRPGEQDVFGCIDTQACNFNPLATCGDYATCDYSCLGCTDPAAPNFDSDATIDNGSCCYNDWVSVSFNEPTFWYAYNYNTGVNYSGSYPDNTGFCASGSCFQFYAWSLSGNPVNYSLTNGSGIVLSSGSLEASYVGISVSNGDEIAGCTFQDACNYNAEATCDDGSCTYYCGGCTDAQALNYNASALYEDGSCFYEMDVPMLQFVVQPAEGLDMYYVRTDVMSVGNGAPYVLTTDANSQAMMVEEVGTYLAGPFPCNQDVTLSLHSASLGFMEYGTSSPVVAPCTSTNVNEQESARLVVFPNPSNGLVQISGLNGAAIQLEVFDMTGRTVMSKQVSANGTALVMDLSGLNNGVYQLRTMNGSDVRTTSLVIQK